MQSHALVRTTIFLSLWQFLAWFLSSMLGAAAIPCCGDPSPAIPGWYAFVSLPVTFAVYLAPAFVCGLLTTSRAVTCAFVAGGIGSLAWSVLGSHIIATLIPAYSISGLGDFTNLSGLLYSFEVLSSLLWSSFWYAVVAAIGACGGIVLRSHRIANSSLKVAPFGRGTRQQRRAP
jgi:hypothetical protein